MGQRKREWHALDLAAGRGEDAAGAAATSSSCPPQAAATSCLSQHPLQPRSPDARLQLPQRCARPPAAASASRSMWRAAGATCRSRSAAVRRSARSCTCSTCPRVCGAPARACKCSARHSCRAWAHRCSSGKDSQARGSRPVSFQAPTSGARGSCGRTRSGWPGPRCGSRHLQLTLALPRG